MHYYTNIHAYTQHALNNKCCFYLYTYTGNLNKKGILRMPRQTIE